MEREYFKNYSNALGRDMESLVWGDAGRPVLFIPCFCGRFFDFENFKMYDHLKPWIEAGQIMVCSIDPIDSETYSAYDKDPHERILRHEQWISYITDEVVPFLTKRVREKNGDDAKTGILAFGCSMGATHCANLYFRFPHMFDSLLALSGIYNSKFCFGDYSDNLVYLNSPEDYLPNMPQDHPYMELYRKQRAAICCGQGDWEHPESTYKMKDIVASLNIPVWVDLWGYDVCHDWDWWFKQTEYFLPYLLGDEDWPIDG